MNKCAFYTLGCKSNQYETNQMKAAAQNAGLQIVPFEQSADFYIINTCTVTQNADKKSRHVIRNRKKHHPKARVIVTGCLTAVEPLEDLKETDLILPNKDKGNLINIFKAKHWLKEGTHRKGTQLQLERVRAFLMIEDGCPGNCSYCIVPRARGKKVKSKPLPSILAEAKDLIQRGTREIVLTGINLGAYAFDLIKVLKALSALDNLYRIRLSSLEPTFLTKALIDAVAETPKVCPHLHIPLQSGDPEILKAMQRPYTPEEYLTWIEYAKKKIPEIGINTDLIVGFPGETEKQFRNTLKLAEKIGFSRIHVFTYSRRKGTLAAQLPEPIDPQTQQERYQRLHALREKLMLDFAKPYKGKKVEVLVESSKNGDLEGLTPNYIRVKCRTSGCSTTMIMPQITAVYPEFSRGKI